MGEGFKLDCQGWLHERALLKNTKLQEVLLTSETLWIYRFMMMIFQLMAEKYLEKRAPFYFCTKARFCLLHGSTVPTAWLSQSTCRVSIICMLAWQGYEHSPLTLPRTHGHRGEGVKTWMANPSLLSLVDTVLMCWCCDKCRRVELRRGRSQGQERLGHLAGTGLKREAKF